MKEESSVVQEELEVLQSVYPDYIRSISEPLILEVPVDLDTQATVIVTSSEGPQDAEQRDCPSVQISHLPPVVLTIAFPTEYPAESPAEIVSVSSIHSWLSSPTEVVTKTLLSLWIRGDGVLYDWVQTINSGTFLQTLGLMGADGTIRLSNPDPIELVGAIRNYDSKSTLTRFSLNSFSCSVCLSSMKGSQCIMLSCSHVFCSSCLYDFWGLCLKEGDVGRIGCPDPICVKDAREANEEEVSRVFNREELSRWKRLRVKREVERDPSVVYCPRNTCQAAVRKPPGRDNGNGWDRFRQCSECHYSFCVVCQHAWHGPIAPCEQEAMKAIILEYIACSDLLEYMECSDNTDGEQRRQVLEQRFGKNVLRRLVKNYQEDALSQQWLESSTTTCPGCRVHVQKSHGCNHMTCWKCKAHFCYLCAAVLNPQHPYDHFNVPGTCHLKLFDTNEGQY